MNSVSKLVSSLLEALARLKGGLPHSGGPDRDSAPTESRNVERPPLPSSVPQPFTDLIPKAIDMVWPEMDQFLLCGQVRAECSFVPSAVRKEPNDRTSYGCMQVLDITFQEIKTLHPEFFGPESKPEDLLNPWKGLIAGVLYDKQMWNACSFAASERERYAFMLSAYNGGLGNLMKDRNMAYMAGLDKNKWFSNVEFHSSRNTRFFEINRRYVRTIFKYKEELQNET